MRSVLSQSTALLDEAVLAPGLQYNRVQIALAFADLEGFVGDPGKQHQLAAGALVLVDGLRASGKLHEIGLTDPVIDADEARAHIILGSALAGQEDFPKAIAESKIGIELYERALALELIESSRRVKWLRRQAEAYEQLGRIIDRFQHDYAAAIGSLQQAVNIFEQLQKEHPGDWLSVAGLAWARFHIAEVARDHQTFDVALGQYESARKSVEEIDEYARRSNDWLDRMAAIYNGSGLVLFDQVSSSMEAIDAREARLSQNSDFARKLNEALGYIAKAKLLTEQLLQSDKSNLAWQAAQGWSLHNLGAVELALGTVVASVVNLNASISDLDQALSIRKDLSRRAPGRLDWRMDLRWTQMHLNTAKARLAEQKGDYAAMRDFFDANIRLVKEAISDDPESDDWWWHEVDSQLSAGDAMALLGQPEEAGQTYTNVRTVAVMRLENAKLKAERDRWARLIGRIDRGPDVGVNR